MRSRIYRALSFFIGALISPVQAQNLRAVTSHSEILVPSSLADVTPPSKGDVSPAVTVERSSFVEASVTSPSGADTSTGAAHPKDTANVESALALIVDGVSSVEAQETINYDVQGTSLQLKRIHDTRPVYHVTLQDMNSAPFKPEMTQVKLDKKENRFLKGMWVEKDTGDLLENTTLSEIDGRVSSDAMPKKQPHIPRGLTKLARKRELWNAFVEFVSNAGSAIVDLGEDAVDSFEDIANEIEGLGEELQAGLEDFADAFEDFGDGIVVGLAPTGQAIVAAGDGIVFVAESIGNIDEDTLLEVGKAVGEAILDLIERVPLFVECLMGKAITEAVEIRFKSSQGECTNKITQQIVKCLQPSVPVPGDQVVHCAIDTRPTDDYPADCAILVSAIFPTFSYEAVIERVAEGDNGSADASLTASVEVGATVTGELDVAINLDPNVPIFDDDDVENSIFMGLTVEATITASLSLSASATGEYSREIELAQKRTLFRKVYMAGPVPVMVEIHVQPMFWIDASAEANAGLSIEVAATLGVGVDVDFNIERLAFEADESLQGSAPQITDFDVSGDISLTSYGRIGLRFHFSVMTYTMYVDTAIALGMSMNLEWSATDDGCLAGSVGAHFGLEGRVVFENPFDFISGFFAGACQALLAASEAHQVLKCMVDAFVPSEMCDQIEDLISVRGLFGGNCDLASTLDDVFDDWHTLVGFDMQLPLTLSEVAICTDEDGESVITCEDPSIDVVETSLVSTIAECFGFDGPEGLAAQSSEFGCPDAPEIHAVLSNNFRPVQANACVSGHNIRQVSTESPELCAQECVAHGSDCVGIEFFRERGICNLSSSTDTSGCDAETETSNEECPRHDITRYYGWSHLSYQGYFTPVDLGKWSDDGLWFRWNSQNPIDVKVCNYGDHTPVYEGSILPPCCRDRVSRTDPPSGIRRIPDEGYYVVRADCDCGSSIDFYPRKPPGTVSTPSGFFPVQENTCVSGENIRKVYDTTPEACARECIAHGSSCVGIEIYKESHNCYLSSGTDTTGCSGATAGGGQGSNFYERKGANDPGYVASPPKGFFVEPDACVSGEDIRILENMSPETCAMECQKYGPSCVGFEFVHSDGGAFNKNRCVLSRSTATIACELNRMDFYKRQFLNTPDDATQPYLLVDGLDGSERGGIAFDVRARHNAYVTLDTGGDHYRVILSDTLSMISCNPSHSVLAWADGSYISREEFNSFFIRWYDGHIWVYHLASSGWEFLMSSIVTTCPTDIERVTVSTGNGSKGRWALRTFSPPAYRFFPAPALSDSCVARENIRTIENTTPEACMLQCVTYGQGEDLCKGIEFFYDENSFRSANSCTLSSGTDIQIGECEVYKVDYYQKINV